MFHILSEVMSEVLVQEIPRSGEILDMYNRYDYDNNFNDLLVNNKLFCTFIEKNELEQKLRDITSQYEIKYNKLFVLSIQDSDEFVITYNVENNTVRTIPHNTILVHRKKHTNTLYTINALNELIKKLNNNIVDTKFPIEWNHYRNTIMLTQQGTLKMLKTKIYQVIEL